MCACVGVRARARTHAHNTQHTAHTPRAGGRPRRARCGRSRRRTRAARACRRRAAARAARAPRKEGGRGGEGGGFERGVGVGGGRAQHPHAKLTQATSAAAVPSRGARRAEIQAAVSAATTTHSLWRRVMGCSARALSALRAAGACRLGAVSNRSLLMGCSDHAAAAKVWYRCYCSLVARAIAARTPRWAGAVCLLHPSVDHKTLARASYGIYAQPLQVAAELLLACAPREQKKRRTRRSCRRRLPPPRACTQIDSHAHTKGVCTHAQYVVEGVCEKG